jgi:hypothetical protein
MRKRVGGYRDRTWAVEGSNGAGRPLAQRLLADGEHVVDVPAKLSARARALDTGHNRKTDPHDAHAVAVVAVRTPALRVLAYDVQLEALRLLVDRRAELSRARIHTVNRVHRLLSELVPGQRKRDITTGQAKTILASVKPRDVAGKTRRRLAAEQIAELVIIEKKVKALTRELKEMVLASGSTLMELPGVGPVVAARTLADTGDVARFRDAVTCNAAPCCRHFSARAAPPRPLRPATTYGRRSTCSPGPPVATGTSHALPAASTGGAVVRKCHSGMISSRGRWRFGLEGGPSCVIFVACLAGTGPIPDVVPGSKDQTGTLRRRRPVMGSRRRGGSAAGGCEG